MNQGKKHRFSEKDNSFIKMAEKGDLEGLETTLEKEKSIPKSIINHALHSLCKGYKTMGQYENCLNLLLRKKADVNWKSPKLGETPLMICAWKGCIDLVKVLIEKDAKINITDSYNKTALFYAIESENGENTNIISMLIHNGGDVNHANKSQETPLIVAVERGHLDTVKLLLEAGANPKVLLKGGEALVEFAQRRNYLSIHSLLCEFIDDDNQEVYGEDENSEEDNNQYNERGLSEITNQTASRNLQKKVDNSKNKESQNGSNTSERGSINNSLIESLDQTNSINQVHNVQSTHSQDDRFDNLLDDLNLGKLGMNYNNFQQPTTPHIHSLHNQGQYTQSLQGQGPQDFQRSKFKNRNGSVGMMQGYPQSQNMTLMSTLEGSLNPQENNVQMYPRNIQPMNMTQPIAQTQMGGKFIQDHSEMNNEGQSNEMNETYMMQNIGMEQVGVQFGTDNQFQQQVFNQELSHPMQHIHPHMHPAQGAALYQSQLQMGTSFSRPIEPASAENSAFSNSQNKQARKNDFMQKEIAIMQEKIKRKRAYIDNIAHKIAADEAELSNIEEALEKMKEEGNVKCCNDCFKGTFSTEYDKISFKIILKHVHDEIELYSNYIKTQVDSRMPKLLTLVELIKATIAKAIPTSEVLVVGSFGTELFMPCSDINFLVSAKEEDDTNTTQEKIQDILAEAFSQQGDVLEDIRTLNIKHSYSSITFICKSNYYRQRIEINCREKNGANSKRASNTLGYLKEYDALKPIFYVVKTLLFNMGLTESKPGHLTSYAIILLIVSMFQRMKCGDQTASFEVKDSNLGNLFASFLNSYGNYGSKDDITLIDILPSQPGKELVYPYVQRNSFYYNQLCIYDSPTRSTNITRHFKKPSQLKKSLSLAYLSMFGCCGCVPWKNKEIKPVKNYKNLVQNPGITNEGVVTYILPRLFNLQRFVFDHER